MAKVIVAGKEGRTLAEAGKSTTEVFKDEKRPARVAAPPLEMKAGDGVSPPVVDGPGLKVEAKEAPKTDEDHVDAEDRDLSDITVEEAQKKARQKITKYANRWQTELRAREKLAEEVAESERFAENLFNERESYRKKAEEAEARANALEQAKPKAPELVAPDEKDKKYYNEAGEFQWKQFSTDNAAYEAKKAIAADRASRAEADAKAKADADNAVVAKKIEDGKKKYPDFEKVVLTSPLELPNSALAYMTQSDYLIDISYFLGTHPDIAEKIKSMHPIRAVGAIRDIETSFEKPVTTAATAPDAPSKPAERQGAPPPITPIAMSGTSPVQLDPAKMDFQQLRAYERERRQRK